LPTPAVGGSAATLASKFFDTTIWAGNGDNVNPRPITSNVDIASGGGLIWTKARNLAVGHFLVDSVRGYTKYIATNSTAAEDTANFGIAGTTNGFTFTTSSGSLNQSPYTYVGWQWKAGGTAVTNTSGSITSSVSANPTSGFSVVTYTGTGANATVGHGLGVAPSMVIVKRRDGGSDNWQSYHISLGKNYTIKLNTTQAQENLSDYWGTGGVTSTVFGINGTYSGINANTGTYVAYCFAPIAGYSAFGSYTGNGSTDGPFVNTGFRPAYVMIKRSDSTDGGEWKIHDATRIPFNWTCNVLFTQAADAENTAENQATYGVDMLSNGFKIRASHSSHNTSAASYIYMAFASHPFKHSLAR
jgi:hypothetical protein